MVDHMFVDYKCPGCNTSYKKPSGDHFFALCYECRQDFGCTTIAQVLETVAFLEQVPEANRAQMGEVMKHKRRQTLYEGSHHRGSQQQAPKLDPERVAAGVRALTEYGLTTPVTDYPQTANYVWASNGGFEVRHTDLADITLKNPTAVQGLTTPLTEGVRLNIPKVPFEMLRQTVAFFRGVVAKFSNGEAIVRIWWNVQERRHEIRVPEGGQRVSGASVHHNDNFDLADARDTEGRSLYLHMMDIHSHNSMSGFWSGVDDNDERKAPEGRMFGVLGKVKDLIPDWKWRMRTREGFIELQVGDLFEIPVQELTFQVKTSLVATLFNVPVKADLKCTVDPFEDATCPDEWYATVNNGRQQGHSGGGWQGAGFRNNNNGRMTVIRTSGTHKPKSHMPMYIFILVGEHLEEFEVDGESMTTTGIKYKVSKGLVESLQAPVKA